MRRGKSVHLGMEEGPFDSTGTWVAANFRLETFRVGLALSASTWGIALDKR